VAEGGIDSVKVENDSPAQTVNNRRPQTVNIREWISIRLQGSLSPLTGLATPHEHPIAAVVNLR